jgi:hypothetical protein
MFPVRPGFVTKYTLTEHLWKYLQGYKAKHADSLALLGHPWLRADDLRLHMIAKLAFEHVHDGRECTALVVAFEVLHVLQNERRGLVVPDDLCGIEEKGTLRDGSAPCPSS